MNQKAYSFNTGAQYKAGAQYASGSLVKLALARPLDIGVASSSQFTARVPDIFSGYTLSNVTMNRIVDLWNSAGRMSFWQNQINFAVWCASSGCGVSAKDHLCALPQDLSWNAYENLYDLKAHGSLCREFGVDPKTDWRRKGLPNYGLGKVYTNGHTIGDGWYYPNFKWGWRGSGTDVTHDPSAPSGYLKESFTERSLTSVLHADYIAQDDSDAGTARLRTGTAFDAQKQFLALPVELPSAIKRYQDTLQNAGSKLDYVLGIRLYMAPSDMLLRMSKIEGYNNEIVIASDSQKLGLNADVNASTVPEPLIRAVNTHNELLI